VEEDLKQSLRREVERFGLSLRRQMQIEADRFV
jgi:hypothetical protein